MLSPSLRHWVLAAVLLCGGCATEEKWPTPQNTTDIVLQDDRRDVLSTVALGDALHVILPPPRRPNTQWQILALSTINLRQMTDLKPVAGRPGAEDITFQAIKVTARTLIRFGAVNPQSANATPDDFFAVGLGIKQPLRGVPATAR